MIKKLLIFILMLLAAFPAGCAEWTGLPDGAAAKPDIVRKAEIAGKWQMYQLKIEVAPGQSVPVLLKLADGDKVDGYFYLEKGNNAVFQVAGNSVVYRSQPSAQFSSGRINSDRFSFTATQAQGTSYTLSLQNPGTGDEQTKITAFLELVYPIGGEIYIELENK